MLTVKRLAGIALAIIAGLTGAALVLAIVQNITRFHTEIDCEPPTAIGQAASFILGVPVEDCRTYESISDDF